MLYVKFGMQSIYYSYTGSQQKNSMSLWSTAKIICNVFSWYYTISNTVKLIYIIKEHYKIFTMEYGACLSIIYLGYTK